MRPLNGSLNVCLRVVNAGAKSEFYFQCLATNMTQKEKKKSDKIDEAGIKLTISGRLKTI